MEKALLSFIFFTISYFSLSNPSSIINLYGTFGIIPFLALFLFSATLTLYYGSLVGISTIFDATDKTVACIVRNKERTASIIVMLLITVTVLSLRYLLGFTIEQIIGGVVLTVLAYLIMSYKKIYTGICDIISKVENLENKENIE